MRQAAAVPLLDVADQTAAAARPTLVAADPAGPCAVSLWLPGLGLSPVLDRGDEGRLWRARARTPRGGGQGAVEWAGTAEVWLEPWHDATVVHLYVRLDPLGPRPSPAAVQRWRGRLVDRWKARMAAWRDAAEASRPPGTPALGAPAAGDGGADASRVGG